MADFAGEARGFEKDQLGMIGLPLRGMVGFEPSYETNPSWRSNLKKNKPLPVHATNPFPPLIEPGGGGTGNPADEACLSWTARLRQQENRLRRDGHCAPGPRAPGELTNSSATAKAQLALLPWELGLRVETMVRLAVWRSNDPQFRDTMRRRSQGSKASQVFGKEGVVYLN